MVGLFEWQYDAYNTIMRYIILTIIMIVYIDNDFIYFIVQEH